MKTKLIFFLVVITSLTMAQDPAKVMEARAREMIRVISLTDKEQWRTFIKDNYTQALIDKNMKAKVSTADTQGGNQSTENSGTNNNLDAKVEMFERLHQDFGGGEISSLTVKDDKVEMKVAGVELTGKFSLRFEKAKPYRIDAIGIEAGN